MPRKSKAFNVASAEGRINKSHWNRRDRGILPHRLPSSIPKITNPLEIIDRLLARALIYALLGFETDDLIALARSIAHSEERRSA